MRKFIILLTVLFSFTVFAQEKGEWFPPGLNIQPFTANFLEPKAGFSYLLGRTEIRLDIGISSDIYKMKINNKTLSFGADLFTFSRLRGTDEFHFPVDAIDYLFGINFGYKVDALKYQYGFRFRLSHISAHFVDGNFDYAKNSWRQQPRVYSREFIEIFPFIRFSGFRGYLGFTYLLNVTPEFIGRGLLHAGFDYFILPFKNKFFTPFIAYDFNLQKINAYSATNIIKGGIKFGEYDKKGISIYAAYYSGKSIHGELFDVNEKYGTIGINLDL